jgi:hypothetical protein
MAKESKGREADGGGHLSNLPIFTLRKYYFDPGSGDVFSKTNRWISFRNYG